MDFSVRKLCIKIRLPPPKEGNQGVLSPCPVFLSLLPLLSTRFFREPPSLCLTAARAMLTPQPSCRVSAEWSNDPVIVKESLDPTVAAWTVSLSPLLLENSRCLFGTHWILEATEHCCISCTLCRGSRAHVCLVFGSLCSPCHQRQVTAISELPSFCKAPSGHSSD